nr:transcription factor SOX 14 [Hymenolepis microstoma]
MIIPEDADHILIPPRPPLIDFSPLNNQKEGQKRPIKPDPEENLTGRRRKVDPTTPSLFAYSVAEFNECGKCGKARLAGLDAWMDHLGLYHTFPTRWPSSRIDDGLLDKDHPYTSVVDSHKKRKRTVIPRPLNSFMIFAQYIRRLTLSSFPDAPNVHISQQVGKLWRNLSNDFREIYATESRRLQDLHSLEFPDYKYQPRRRLRSEEYEPLPSQAPSCPPRPLNSHHYFEKYEDTSKSKTPPKNPISHLPSPRKFDRPYVSSGCASCFFNFPSISTNRPNTDTQTSPQGVDKQRANHQYLNDSSFYQGHFSYESTNNHLSWAEDKIMRELQGPPRPIPAPGIASSDEMLSPSGDNWYQYQREDTFGEPPPLPGIETWTFSGPTI